MGQISHHQPAFISVIRRKDKCFKICDLRLLRPRLLLIGPPLSLTELLENNLAVLPSDAFAISGLNGFPPACLFPMYMSSLPIPALMNSGTRSPVESQISPHHEKNRRRSDTRRVLASFIHCLPSAAILALGQVSLFGIPSSVTLLTLMLLVAYLANTK